MTQLAAIAAAQPASFEQVAEHAALRSVLRQFFSAAAAAADPQATTWRRLIVDVGAQDILLVSPAHEMPSTAVDLAILAEEAGAALFGGPVLSALAIGPLLPVLTDTDPATAASIRRGDLLPAVAGSLVRSAPTSLTGRVRHPDEIRWDGTAEPVWDLPGAHVVVADAVLGKDPAVAVIDATSHGVTATERSSLDISRTVGHLRCDDAPAAVMIVGPQAIDTTAAIQRRVDLVLSAELLGVARHTVDQTVHYAKHRIQFGRTIGSFQAVKHRLADMLVAVELTRSAVYGAAWHLDNQPGAAQTDVDLAVAAYLARRTAMTVTKAAVQLHGGIAVTWEHWAHRYLRRAHAVAALSGDPAAHRRRLADLVDIRDGFRG